MNLIALFALACGGNTAHEPAPAPHEPPAPAAAPAEAGTLALSGTVTFEGSTDAAAVFVSVKDPNQPGPPLAAKKLPPGPFPLSFSLTSGDIMQMGPTPRAIPETVVLSITLDKDGDAMTKEPTDPKAVLQVKASSEGHSVALKAQ